MAHAMSLKFVERGIGGVDEMSVHLDDTKVFFGEATEPARCRRPNARCKLRNPGSS